jgi:hypothetical protein
VANGDESAGVRTQPGPDPSPWRHGLGLAIEKLPVAPLPFPLTDQSIYSRAVARRPWHAPRAGP